MNTDQKPEECACRKALEDLERVMRAFPAFSKTRLEVNKVLATPCECAELAAANERAERARKESTDKAECIRELVKGIDGAEYWAPMDAVAYIAKGFLRLRKERDAVQAGWKEAVEALRVVAVAAKKWDDGLIWDEASSVIRPEDAYQALAIVARFDAQGGGK
jgi:hypothetical protein